ncbi:polysaccharide biosynthesis/export family protein [Paracidobacterium acidisoli]|uniref:Polysaccharide export protein n=1 Tax=Paracidobacterium acidisoli TaxID=2303751 RepID=A0A372IR45_9BACT|nr:polysaccharide biosynthesis/export family protein [Paracidobacterium acidisoli]MBT9330255.1 polysaccharide export protein [Paracidobacterium acidisoli]
MKHAYSSIPVCMALLLGLSPAGMRAQQTPAQAVPVSTTGAKPAADPQLKISPLRQLQEFEPAADAQYQIGAGDTIDLYVAGHPELSHPYTVGPDGRITLQIAGSVTVVNMTRDIAAKAVADALSAYYTSPAVTIGVEKYGSNTIMVFGAVQHPGVLDYEGTPPTLLDAIARAGMTTVPGSKDGLPERCMIYRGNDQAVTVELKQLLTSGNPLSDIRLRRGDMVFIPIQQQQFISVLGEVLRPGPVPLTGDLDLKMAITDAGGLGEGAGSNPTIHIAQTATNKEITISFHQLMKPGGGNEIKLQPGDMVFIPKSGFYKLTYLVSKISPVATMVSLGALAAP